MGKYLASIIDTLNHDVSVDKVRDTTYKLNKLLASPPLSLQKFSYRQTLPPGRILPGGFFDYDTSVRRSNFNLTSTS